MKRLCNSALASMLLFCAASSPAATRPNIVVVLTDDQGWGDLSVHGNTNLQTPHIDSLARDGALFERFFVCTVCSPTRAEFLTGRYHPRGGVHGVSTGGERLDLDETTIAQVFKAAGYATGAFGKWHNGTQWPYHPNARGFDEYYGFTSGHWGSYFAPPLDHNGQLVEGKGYLIDDLTDRALEFIDRHQAGPFFCYLPFNTPHSPMQVPDRFYEKFREAEVKMRHGDAKAEDVAFTRAALAMCENIDWNVGRVLARLEALKLSENTVVVYFSDNGPNSARWNGGMKGRKGSLDEGGLRVPFLIRWPGRIAAGAHVSPIAGAIDLLPTLADLAGVPIPGARPLDGVSLKPLLTGQAVPWPERLLYSHWNGKVSVRSQRFRLDNDGRLFDLAADPGQERDVAAAQPDLALTLSQARAAWRSEMLREMGTDSRPFPVGYREAPLTHLPARDGVPHGGIKRSAPAPNCSFFQNWTSPADAMTWDIEVATSGVFEASVYYTCAATDTGSTVEISFNGRRLESTVSQPNDPPLRGAEQDRVPRRGESYVKDFKSLRLGTFPLERGRGKLTLRALNVAGRYVMDVRMIALNLQK